MLVKGYFYSACLLTLALRYRNEDLEYKSGPIQSLETRCHHVEGGSHQQWTWAPSLHGSLWCNCVLFGFKKDKKALSASLPYFPQSTWST